MPDECCTAFNKKGSTRTCRNVCRGLREKAKQGKWPAGAPPFGYTVGPDGKLALGNPQHVQAIRRVFREYLSGNSMRAVVEWMRAAGQPAPGKEWTRDALRTVLENEQYTGDFHWGNRKSGKYNHATEEPIFISCNHTAIIDRKTFNAVQGRRVEQRGGKTPKLNGGTFVLSGLIRCHQCGEKMHGHCTKANNYLICGGHTRKGNAFCDRNSVREDVVLDQIIGAIERVYLNPELIQRMREELRHQYQDGSAPVDVGQFKQKLAQVEKDLQTARRNMALAEPGLLPEYEEIFRELRSRQAYLKSEIKAGSETRNEHMADEVVDRAVALLSQLRPTCRRADPVQLREFLRQAVGQVVIRVDKRRIGCRNRYKLRGGEIHMRNNNLGVTARRGVHVQSLR
ncbi:MAG: recombinase family protein [Pirellulales bacterium]